MEIESKIVGWKVVKQNTATGEKTEELMKPKKRPQVLTGQTHKLVNHAKRYNLYVTVNCLDDAPYEVFFTSSHVDASEWVIALSRMVSSMLQSGTDLEAIAKQLIKVHSDQGYHAGGKGGYVAGIVQHIGKTLMQIYKGKPVEVTATGQQCPECGEMTLIKEGGCTRCTNDACGYLGECG